MIDGREPNYICLDTRALSLVKRLPDTERLAFFDGICAAYADKLSGGKFSVFPDNMTGDLIRQAAATMNDGFDAYMSRVYANPSGKKRTADPMGSQWGANDTQSNQDQDKNNQDKINQIKPQLKSEGYDESEIDNAINRSKGKTVRDLAAYIRRTIENERRQGKRTLPAQAYTQRDYSDVQAEIEEHQRQRIIERLREREGSA